MKLLLVLLLSSAMLGGEPKVHLGIDLFFSEGHVHRLKGKNVALVTNQTGVDSQLCPTLERLQKAASNFKVVAVFAPEHGLSGISYAEENIQGHKAGKLHCFSLHGDHVRPTAAMLKGIDLIIYDIQEIGCRSYTYATTLYYIMEEAAKKGIDVVVLDRPNPLGGEMIDGPMVHEKNRSFASYINVPYCHGMTIGELARFFNGEYGVGCSLQVIAMKGWRRSMTFEETGLLWIPTSPQIPEADTPFFYPMTGLMGGLGLVSIGVGYTLPFKVVGAPWIEAEAFAKALNRQKLNGVKFLPFHFKPFFGIYKHEECHGVRIVILDHQQFRPVTVDYLIMGVLKSLYPQEVMGRLEALPENKIKFFCNANGTTAIWDLLVQEKYAGWKMVSVDQQERAAFLTKREKYLLY
jgi:uncharacterized protein YbbC (DUF1343 family)